MKHVGDPAVMLWPPPIFDGPPTICNLAASHLLGLVSLGDDPPARAPSPSCPTHGLSAIAGSSRSWRRRRVFAPRRPRSRCETPLSTARILDLLFPGASHLGVVARCPARSVESTPATSPTGQPRWLACDSPPSPSGRGPGARPERVGGRRRCRRSMKALQSTTAIDAEAATGLPSPSPASPPSAPPAFVAAGLTTAAFTARPRPRPRRRPPSRSQTHPG
jgi:hypothetical protein